MSRTTVDNRDMQAQEEYLMARIEALQRRVKELEAQLESHTTKFASRGVFHTPAFVEGVYKYGRAR